MNLVDELHLVAAALVRAGVRHAVCGGVAVTAFGATRSTKDIDVLIDPADVGIAMAALRDIGFSFAALPMVFDEGTAKERHVQRLSKIEGQEHLALDLLLAKAALSDFLDGRLEVKLPEGPLWVVSRTTLIRMKRMAGRSQDLADLEKLSEVDGGGGD